MYLCSAIYLSIVIYELLCAIDVCNQISRSSPIAHAHNLVFSCSPENLKSSLAMLEIHFFRNIYCHVLPFLQIYRRVGTLFFSCDASCKKMLVKSQLI